MGKCFWFPVISLCTCVLLSACGPAEPDAHPDSAVASHSVGAQDESPVSASSGLEESVAESFQSVNYVRDLADEVLKPLIQPQMTDEEKLLAAYRYLIANVYFADPIGVDAWYYRSSQEEPPDFIELRALSPLAFGIGSCEDFACAMVVLAEQMGFDSLYVPGFTISVDGEYVDHAWTLVRVGGGWYHLDPQLEQNIVRSNIIKYSYFLKSDDDMLVNHKWGENLIEYRPDISAMDVTRIRELYTPPACPASMPPLESGEITLPARPDAAGILRELEDEKIRAGRPAIEYPDITPPILIH